MLSSLFVGHPLSFVFTFENCNKEAKIKNLQTEKQKEKERKKKPASLSDLSV